MTTVTEARPLPATAKPQRHGDHILLTVPHYWGKGPTLAAAKKKLSDAGGDVKRHWRIHSVHPDTYLSELGYIICPKGHPPVTLAESNPS